MITGTWVNCTFPEKRCNINIGKLARPKAVRPAGNLNGTNLNAIFAPAGTAAGDLVASVI